MVVTSSVDREGNDGEPERLLSALGLTLLLGEGIEGFLISLSLVIIKERCVTGRKKKRKKKKRKTN